VRDDPRSEWPIRWLKTIARLLHEYATWVGVGHSIPNGDPPKRIANTRFVGVAVGVPLFAPDGFDQISTSSGRTIHVHTLVPLHREEMDLELASGWELLFTQLFDAQQGMFIESERPNVAQQRRPWWWPFG